jgi:hypothetical protein
MTLPALLFGVLLSTAYGAAFHFYRGGSMNRLVLYLILGWLGFWAGHYLGWSMAWDFFAVGPLYVGAATLGSLIFLVVGYYLSNFEIPQE